MIFLWISYLLIMSINICVIKFMKIIVTGAAGFIGFHVVKKLIKLGYEVIGLDNINNYYDTNLKKRRLEYLKKLNKKFVFKKIDLRNFDQLKKIFIKNKIGKVVHLAAQAGVRYSLKNPHSYIENNINAFFNIIELSKIYKIKNFVYASTSSVYGANKNLPFSENKIADHPIQLYAASKRSNELIAHAYSSLYNLPTTGLRFFTAYGPWGRPDQAIFIFTKNILENKKINLFNNGNHSRDFTYIDDIVNAIYLCLKNIPKKNKKWNPLKPNPSSSLYPFRIFNIGSNKKVELKKYVKIIEKILNKKAKISLKPLQKGDVIHVSSSIKNIKNTLKYEPKTSVEDGVKNFVRWFLDYYEVK